MGGVFVLGAALCLASTGILAPETVQAGARGGAEDMGEKTRAPERKNAVSLNFDNADLTSVIETVFRDTLRVAYVIDPRVKGRITVRSPQPIPESMVLEVIEAVLRFNGVGVTAKAGLYRIAPLGEGSDRSSFPSSGRDAKDLEAGVESVIQVAPVTCLRSTEVMKLITPFLSGNAIALDVPKTSQIILVGADAGVRSVLQLIDILDKDTPKKRATVHVYQVQNGKARDIAGLLNRIFLGAGTGQLPGAPGVPAAKTRGSTSHGQPRGTARNAVSTPSGGMTAPDGAGTERPAPKDMLVSETTRIYSDDTMNSVIVLASPEDYDLIRETIAKIDIVPRQVVIEGVIAQVTLTDELTLGLAYSMGVALKTGGGSLSGFIGLNPGTLQSLSATTQSGSGFTFVGADRGGAVRTYINALASHSRAKLLAVPHIIVSDNREARIQVGKQVPLLTSETFGSTTTQSQRNIRYRDIGIILKVRPRINASGLVNLEMNQEVSTYGTITLYSNETQIVLDKTEASSSLVVRDGQTIIIGGLIREDITTDGSGIPFLRDIPVLGWLFGGRHRKTERVELVILLTPHVIRDQGEAAGITSRYVGNITGMDRTEDGLTVEELTKGGAQIRKGLGDPGRTEAPRGDGKPELTVPLPHSPPRSGSEGPVTPAVPAEDPDTTPFP